MKNKYNASTLSKELMFTNLLCTFIPTLIATFVLTTYYQYQAQADSEVAVTNALTSIAQSTYSYISDTERLMTTIAYDKEVLDEIDSAESDEPSIAVSKNIFNYLKTSRKDLNSIIVADSNHNICYSNKNMNMRLRDDIADSSSSCEDFFDTNDLRYPYSFIGVHEPSYFTFSSTKNVFTIVQTIHHPYNRDANIYIYADTDISLFHDMFSQLKFSDPAVFVVLDADGNTVYSSEELSVETIKLIAEKNEKLSIGRNHYNIYREAIIPSGWKISILINNQTLNNKLRIIYIIDAIMALFIIVSSAVAFQVISKETTDSFKNMSATMQKVKGGDFSVQCEVYGNGELRSLQLSFNDMIKKLKEYIDREYIFKLKQNNAEIRALQSQIQPHFLYNMLNSFIGLNRNHQTQKLEYSIINLTCLLRYTLSDSTVVRVEEEMEFLQKYCDLQKIRFDTRMEYSINFSDSVKDYLIPKLIVQPIVENSIKHAVESTDDVCNISIDAIPSNDNGEILIIVEDDGPGYDTDIVNHSNGGKESIGIKNVIDRLQLMCDGYIAVQSELGNGAKTVFHIKKEANTYENISC